MAGLGDYIHYSFKNYKKYGLLRKRQFNYTGRSNGAEVFATQKKLMQQEVLNNGKYNLNIKGLETTLNKFYGKDRFGKTIDGGLSEQDRNRLTDAMYAQLEEVTGEAYEKYENLAAKSAPSMNGNRVANVNAEQIRKSKSYRNKRTEGKANYKAIQKEVRRFINIYQTSLKLGYTQSQQVIDTMSKLQLEMRTLAEKVAAGGSRRISKTDDVYKYLMELNQAFNYGVATQAIGLLGEMAVPIILSALQNGTDYAIDNIADTFAKNVVGTITTNSVLNVKYLAKNLDPAEITRGTSYTTAVNDEYGNTIAFSSGNNNVQQKIDVTATFQGVPFNASVKNYAYHSGFNVGLLNGSSLLALVQQYDTFVNHYLNVMAANSNTGGLNNKAKEAMKYTIFRQALIGERSFTNNGTNQTAKGADTFIYHDHTNGRFYVYSMGELITRAMSFEDAIQIKGLENEQYTNQWIGNRTPNTQDAALRISNILRQMMATKIGVSMDFNKVIGS